MYIGEYVLLPVIDQEPDMLVVANALGAQIIAMTLGLYKQRLHIAVVVVHDFWSQQRRV